MARGKVYPQERTRWEDPSTGAVGWQLTSFPTVSWLLPYFFTSLCNGFSHDGRTLLFRSRRFANRDAPFDLFRVNVDGTDLAQLTEAEGIGGFVTANTQRVVYYFDKGTLRSVGLDTFGEDDIGHVDLGTPHFSAKGMPPGQEWLWGSLTPDDRWYFTHGVDHDGNPVTVRIATDGTQAGLFDLPPEWNFAGPDPRGLGVLASKLEDDRPVLYLLDFEGVVLERYGYLDRYAHSCCLGTSGLWQGCALPPEQALLLLKPGMDEPETLVEGPYFWHSSASLDGEWIVADTNWPNEGVQLVNVKTRRFCRLLHPRQLGRASAR